MSFFRICPREPQFNKYIFEDIDLKVIQKDGIQINPDFDVNITDLNNGYKHFKTYNGKGTSFKISVIIGKDEKLQGYKSTKKTGSKYITETNTVTVEIDNEIRTFEEEIATGVEIFTIFDYYKVKLTTLLSYFMRNGIPFMVYSNIIGINTAVPYLITENKRKQEYYDYTIWELTFTRWQEVNYSSFKKTNKGITKAIKKWKAKKKAKAKAKAKAKTTTRQKLAKCKRTNIVYSKKQKTVECVRLMQKILYKHKFLSKSQVDGWYGKETVNAVKKYQEKFKKKYNLKKNGKIDKATFNVMCGKGKLASTSKKSNKTANSKPKSIKTINIKSGTKNVQSKQSISKNNKWVSL